MKWLEWAGNVLWNPWLLAAFLIVGLVCSLQTGFFQVFGARTWMRKTAGKILNKSDCKPRNGLSQLQALSTALASTIGTGSIAGVATAIFYGGPGAIFWMWVSALLGMMTGFVEKTMTIRYRRREGKGWIGGPMYYMSGGLHMPRLAAFFAFFCVCATLVGGNLVQSNSIAAAISTTFGVSRVAVGLSVAVLAGVVILGGINRIAGVSELLVPVMASLFLIGGCVVLVQCRSALPAALQSIFRGALTLKAAAGGGVGYGILAAMRYGVARGVFTNEAGLGSSAMAHAAAEVNDPAEQGMWGIFEVFVATIVVCTVTALVILSTGVYSEEAALAAIESGMVNSDMLGVPLSATAFATVLGQWGNILVSVCLVLFAFSSILGWSYYGEQSLRYLVGSNKLRPFYRILFFTAIILGSVSSVNSVWLLADIFNALMAAPNLFALLLLSPQAAGELARFCKQQTIKKAQQ